MSKRQDGEDRTHQAQDLVGDLASQSDTVDESSSPLAQQLKRQAEQFGTDDDSKRLVLGDLIATGGMGEIFEVEDPSLNRTVALKKLKKIQNISARSRARFVREAQIAAQLSHPNIIPIYQFGFHGSSPYFTMKQVSGESLAEITERLAAGEPQSRKKYPIQRRLQIFIQVANAIAFAHSKGVIHRDLKPDNVMIGEFGEVLVMDWGLAKTVSQKQGASDDSALFDSTDTKPPSGTLNLAIIKNQEKVESIREALSAKRPHNPTQAGQILGTPLYMSPEQARGEIELVDHRSDIYCLGCLLTNLLVFRPAFYPEPREQVIDRVRNGEILLPGDMATDPAVPPQLISIIRKSTALDIDERYQDVRALVQDIESYLTGMTVSTFSDTIFIRLQRLFQRHKLVSTIALTILLTITAFILFDSVVSKLQRQSKIRELIMRGQSALAKEDFSEALNSSRQIQTLDKNHRAAEVLEQQAKARQLQKQVKLRTLSLKGLMHEAFAMSCDDDLESPKTDNSKQERVSRSIFYERHFQAMDEARQLMLTVQSATMAKKAFQVISRRLARQMIRDQSFEMAKVILNGALNAGLHPSIYKAELHGISRKKQEVGRDSIEDAKTIFNNLPSSGRVQESAFEALVDRIVMNSTPALTSFLISQLRPIIRDPFVFDQDRLDMLRQRLIISALGRLGDTSSRAYLRRKEWSSPTSNTNTIFHRFRNDCFNSIFGQGTNENRLVNTSSSEALSLLLSHWIFNRHDAMSGQYDSLRSLYYYSPNEIGRQLIVALIRLEPNDCCVYLALAWSACGPGSSFSQWIESQGGKHKFPKTKGEGSLLNDPVIKIITQCFAAQLTSSQQKPLPSIEQSQGGIDRDICMVALAWTRLMQSSLPQAKTTITRISDQSYYAVDKYYVLAKIALRLKKYREAYELATLASAIYPKYTKIRQLLGEILVKQGKTDQALEIFDDIIAGDPDFIAARKLRVQSYLERGQPDRCLGDLDILIAVTEKVEYRMARGRYFMSIHCPRLAEQDASAALNKNPNYYPGYRLRADALIAQYQNQLGIPTVHWQQAILDLERALRVKPNDHSTLFKLAELNFKISFGRTNSFKFVRRAIKYLELAMQIETDIRHFILKNRLLQQIGASSEQLEVLQQSLKEKPVRQLQLAHIRAQISLKRFTKAEKLAFKLLTQGKADAADFVLWYEAAEQTLKPKELQRALEKLQESAPPKVKAKALLFQAIKALQQSDLSACEVSLKASRSQDDKDPELWWVWSNLERIRQRPKEQLSHLRRAITLTAADDPLLGVVRLRMKEASTALSKAMK